MRRTSRLVLLIGIFLAAIVFIVIATGITTTPPPTASVAPTTAEVVIAVSDISLGTVVTQAMVTKTTISIGGKDPDNRVQRRQQHLQQVELQA